MLRYFRRKSMKHSSNLNFHKYYKKIFQLYASGRQNERREPSHTHYHSQVTTRPEKKREGFGLKLNSFLPHIIVGKRSLLKPAENDGPYRAG